MALSDEALIQILRQEETAAENWNDSELSQTRKDSLDYYDRKLLGDEQEGQSKVITSEFADTVESFMPGLMRVFASGEDVVEFTPMSQKDEQAAKEASQYVPHVFMRENEGFINFYTFFKDALMGRLSALTVDTEEVEKKQTDAIDKWTAEQLAAAEMAAKEVGATDVVIEVEPDPAPAVTDVDPTTGQPIPAAETYSGTITLTRTKKRVTISPIAPEDVRVSPGARDIDSASYVGYLKQVTASDLRKLGLSQDEIDEISSDRNTTEEEDQRQNGLISERSPRKDSERRFWLVVAYVCADDNGDGISEMMRVVYAHAGGGAGRIIERMEWTDGEAPIALGTPILMPHTIVGRSIFDQVKDLQDVGTALTRGMLDNLYLTNRPRPMVNGRVNINSVIDWTPGMPIQVTGNDNPNASIGFLQVPSIMDRAIGGLEYFATVRENRTGVTRYNQGLDADSLNKTASGINMVMTAAQQRQELIARTFAETAIKRLMRLVYRAIKRTASGPIQYHAGADDWAECDPTKWPDDMHLVTNVALGTGNKQQEMQNLMLIGAAQEKLVAAQGGPDGPLVKPEHFANTARKLIEAAGFKGSSAFIASPREIKGAAPKQPQPSPEMLKVQAQAEAKQAELAMQAQHDQAKLAQENEMQRQRLMADIALKREAAQADMQIKREQAALDMQLAREKAQLDAELKRQELSIQGQLKKYEIDTAPTPTSTNIPEQQVSA